MIFDGMLRNFDNVSSEFLMYPRFIQTFLDKQLDGLPTHKEKYDVSFHTKKVFTNMKRIGKGFSGKETSLFPTTVGPNQVQMGEGSAQPTNIQHTPTFDMPPTKPKKTQKPRKPKRKTTNVPQPSKSTDITIDEAVHKEGRQGTIRDTSAHTRDVDKEEVVEVVTTAKMIIDTVVDVAQVTTAIADVLVNAAKIIVTAVPTITAESTKTNVKELFNKAMKRINTFVDFRTELVGEITKKDKIEMVQESSLKRTRDDLEQERSKKQKMEDDKESTELKRCLEIILDDGDDVTIDATCGSPLLNGSLTLIRIQEV
nr:hypothetical protein [Tanacetum cinerariifolium]GEX95740.1 hypothetical protein [Tanacetum cinerariifolium]